MKNTTYFFLITILIGIALSCGCTMEIPGVIEQVTTIPTQAPTPTPQIIYITVLVTPTPGVATTTPTASPTHSKTLTLSPTTSKPTAVQTTKKPIYVVQTTASLGSMQIKAAGGLGGNIVPAFIALEGTNDSPISLDSCGNLTGSQEYTQIDILPDGTSAVISLVPGDYVAYLPAARNGTTTEWQNFTINANSQTLITFSGTSYRASLAGGCSE